jgi:hypothetical protein
MQLTTFNFDAAAVRVVTGHDGEPWFVAADVATALTIGRTDDAVGRLDDDEKGAATIRTPGGDQQMSIINESGLYSLILTSRKPEAKRFKRWVTHEVLPAIRKTGAYVAPGANGELFPSAPAQDPRIALLAGLKAAGVLSSAGAEFASFRLLGLRPPPALTRAAAPVAMPAPAPVQLQIETKPKPKQKRAPKRFKLTVTRNRNTVDGVNLVIGEVAAHCGVSLTDLVRSMSEHGLVTGPLSVPTELGREFVAFNKQGCRYWKVGALIRHLSA